MSASLPGIHELLNESITPSHYGEEYLQTRRCQKHPERYLPSAENAVEPTRQKRACRSQAIAHTLRHC